MCSVIRACRSAGVFGSNGPSRNISADPVFFREPYGDVLAITTCSRPRVHRRGRHAAPGFRCWISMRRPDCRRRVRWRRRARRYGRVRILQRASGGPRPTGIGPSRRRTLRAVVDLDGTGHRIPMGSLDVQLDGSLRNGLGATASVSLPAGTHGITLTVDDGAAHRNRHAGRTASTTNAAGHSVPIAAAPPRCCRRRTSNCAVHDSPYPRQTHAANRSIAGSSR